MPKFVTIDYTNWRGERAHRYIRPIRMEWGSNQWHQEPQWLLIAYDAERRDERAFAMSGVHEWVQDPVDPPADDLAPIPGDIINRT